MPVYDTIGPQAPDSPIALKFAELLRKGKIKLDEFSGSIGSVPGTPFAKAREYLPSLGDIVVGKAPEALEKVAYGRPLVSGRANAPLIGEDVMDLAGVTPVGMISKGARKAGTAVAGKVAKTAEDRIVDVIRKQDRGWNLEGLQDVVGSERYGGYKPAQKAAEDYASRAGLDYKPIQTYQDVDPAFAKRVSDAYAAMQHAPNDPAVRAAYEKLIEETMGQYEAARRAGQKFEFMQGGVDPYGNPRNALKDIYENKRLQVFPTDQGFGGASSTLDVSQNPLLALSGEKWGGKPATVNDIFRGVHDYFGHAKQGVGFRARGEENAYLQHAGMFSPEATRALASETRGQNSWLNFGPYGERNRTATTAETEFAPQKTGLLPDELVFGRTPYGDAKLEKALGIAKRRERGLPLELSSNEAPQAPTVLTGSTPSTGRLFPKMDSPYTPQPQVELPRQGGTGGRYNERMAALLRSDAAQNNLADLIAKGHNLDMQHWYGTSGLREAALNEGLTEAEFDRMLAHFASASQRNPVDKQNMMGSYMWNLDKQGLLTPQHRLLTNKLREAGDTAGPMAELPTGLGSLAQTPIFERSRAIATGTPIDEVLDPRLKLGTFYQNLRGNLLPVTVDVNAMRGATIPSGNPDWLATKLVEKDDKTGKVINVHTPRADVLEGRMSMKEAQQRPGFWTAAPEGSDYGGFEELWQRSAESHGLAPAEAQALGWYGSGDITALKTKPELYEQNLERLINARAQQLGIRPTEMLSRMLRGQEYLR